MYWSGRKEPSLYPWIQPSAAARLISSSAQWSAVSVKVVTPATPLSSNRAQMAANSARVMLASGSNRPELRPVSYTHLTLPTTPYV